MVKFKIVVARIETLDVDAIVNAANKTLLGGGGVDGAIHKAAGPQLLEECRHLHGCRPGEAKITRGYNLPARYIIHTVGPRFKVDFSPRLTLYACYANALTLARMYNLHSIAFPAISTGAFGFPKDLAAEIALSAVRDYINANPDDDLTIIFCVDKINENYRQYHRIAPLMGVEIS